MSLLRLWKAIAALHPIAETFKSPKKTGKHLLLCANCQTGRSQSWRKFWGIWCYLWVLRLWLLAGIDHGHVTLECKELFGLCWTSLGFLTWTLGIAKGCQRTFWGFMFKAFWMIASSVCFLTCFFSGSMLMYFSLFSHCEGFAHPRTAIKLNPNQPPGHILFLIKSARRVLVKFREWMMQNTKIRIMQNTKTKNQKAFGKALEKMRFRTEWLSSGSCQGMLYVELVLGF